MRRSVFISYSHGQDGIYVRRLANFLQKADIPVWHDEDLMTGDRWDEVVQEALDRSAALVVVMTPMAAKSSWVNREVARAQDQGKPIFPLLLDGEPFFRLSEVQFDTVTGGRMPSQAFVNRLIDATAASGADNPLGPDESPRAAGLVASLPYLFNETAFVDLRLLTMRMTQDWDAARDHVGRQASTLDAWLRDHVRDLSLPANILADGTEDLRIARLAAHYNPDGKPVYRGREVDVPGIITLCEEASAGSREAATLVASLTRQSILIFASHTCHAGHPACRGTGCSILRELPANLSSAWHGTKVLFDGTGFNNDVELPKTENLSTRQQRRREELERGMYSAANQLRSVSGYYQTAYDLETAVAEQIRPNPAKTYHPSETDIVRCRAIQQILDRESREALSKKVATLSQSRSPLWIKTRTGVDGLEGLSKVVGNLLLLDLAEPANKIDTIILEASHQAQHARKMFVLKIAFPFAALFLALFLAWLTSR